MLTESEIKALEEAASKEEEESKSNLVNFIPSWVRTKEDAEKFAIHMNRRYYQAKEIQNMLWKFIQESDKEKCNEMFDSIYESWEKA